MKDRKVKRRVSIKEVSICNTTQYYYNMMETQRTGMNKTRLIFVSLVSFVLKKKNVWDFPY